MTGPDLIALIEARARVLGTTPARLVAPISTSSPHTWLKHLREAAAPRPHTVARIQALLAGEAPASRISPARCGIVRKTRPDGDPVVSPLAGFAQDRDPCPMCGVRGDIGCKHQRRAGL